MPGEQLEHLVTVALATGPHRPTQHELVTAVVHRGPEGEAGLLARPLDGPSGEGARHLGDVGLRVAAVHTQRVKLHQLAGVVLVEPGPPTGVGAGAHGEARTGAEPVVEVEQHGRMMGGRPQQVGEAAERVGTDDVALVGREVPAHLALAREDVEVVEPEVDHHLLQLPLARHRPQHLRGLQLAHDLERPLGRPELAPLVAGHLAAGELAPGLRVGARVLALQVADRHRQRGERGEGALGHRIVDTVGVQLTLEPGGEADGLHLLGVARPWPVGHPLQDVPPAFVHRRGQRGGDRHRSQPGRGRRLVAESAAARAGRGERNDGNQPGAPHRGPSSPRRSRRCCWRCSGVS